MEAARNAWNEARHLGSSAFETENNFGNPARLGARAVMPRVGRAIKDAVAENPMNPMWVVALRLWADLDQMDLQNQGEAMGRIDSLEVVAEAALKYPMSVADLAPDA